MMPFDGGKYSIDEMPSLDRVAIESILNQHRERYVLHTSQGSIVFKHITKRMKLAVDRIRYTRYPKLREMEEEGRIVFPIVMAGNADDETVRRAEELVATLRPSMDLYALGIIEYPFLTDADDIEEFMESLTEEEQEAVRQILELLTSWNRPIDYSQLEIAERFHVQMITAQHIQDPTWQQYLALHNVVEQEHKATEDMYSKLGVKL